MPADPREVERLLREAEEQGVGRYVSDPATLARVAAITSPTNEAPAEAGARPVVSTAVRPVSPRQVKKGGRRVLR